MASGKGKKGDGINKGRRTPPDTGSGGQRGRRTPPNTGTGKKGGSK
jgi:hypothetical protein